MNILGYSDSDQTLNGITTITDGDGASISNGNAVFLDTNTNTITVNNILKIPLTSQIYFYGSFYLPDFAYFITEAMMDTIYTQNNNHQYLITSMNHKLPVLRRVPGSAKL